MFSQKIIDSDAFLDMPLSTQSLYFHLNMRADDDGFINNPKKIQRMIGASDDDLRVLLAKRFILSFDSGVIVIKHWRMHNTLQKDRYKPTQYQEEYSTLLLKKNRSYTDRNEDALPLGNCLETDCIQSGNKVDTQYSIVENSIDKNSVVVVEGNGNSNSNSTNVDESVDNSKMELMYGTLGQGVVLLTDNQRDSLIDQLGLDAFDHYIKRLANFIIEKKANVGNHYATILKWYAQDKIVNR
jgi:hypothetical protein